MRTYNLYCDESCHLENDRMSYMLLGYIKALYNQIKHHKKRLFEIKHDHLFYTEIKWSERKKGSGV